MFETLVKIMRHCVATCDCPTCPVDDKVRATYCITSTFTQAADAIEELSKQLDDMNEANIALYGALPKWELDSDPGEPWRYVCNICGEKTKDTVMGKPRANFCPNCGADMREESRCMTNW